MAKRILSTQLKGSFNLELMEITEVTKDAEKTYNFLEILQDYAGKTITVSIKEENEIEPIGE
jgi:hypothetical protein